MFDYPVEWKDQFLEQSAQVVGLKLGIKDYSILSYQELLRAIRERNAAVSEKFSDFCIAYEEWYRDVVVEGKFESAHQKIIKRDGARSDLVDTLRNL